MTIFVAFVVVIWDQKSSWGIFGPKNQNCQFKQIFGA